MKKKTDSPELRAEYDFRGGARGKYTRAAAEGSNVVVLEPDVAVEFPTSEAVNDALRKVVKAKKSCKRGAA